MLRITHAQIDTEYRWTLCGQLAGPWVAELRVCWDHWRQAAAGARAVVNLSDVTFIDEGGEALLSEMRSDGAEFVAVGVETKHLIENLKAKGDRPLRRFVGPLASDCEKTTRYQEWENRVRNQLTLIAGIVLAGAALIVDAGCTSKVAAAGAQAPPEVLVATVQQKDLPIEREWIGRSMEW